MAVFRGRLCRQCKVFLICIVDFMCLLTNHVVSCSHKKVLFLVILLLASIFTWCWLRARPYKHLGTYTTWRPRRSVKKPTESNVFVHGSDDDIYMYSAIANYQQPYNEELNIIVTSLDSSRSSLKCCVLMDNSTLYSTDATQYFSHYTKKEPLFSWLREYHPEIHYARQHACIVPHTGHVATHVTLTSKSCSMELKDYVPITRAAHAPGGLALCAKIAHSGGIDPEKFIEWMEVQRIQGVDKVLIFNLGNPESLLRVFRYYQDLGVLDVQPYDLPGSPHSRTLLEKNKRTEQFKHDETMSVLECRQRLGGYTYVMGHDVDEFIIPRQDVDLKTFFNKRMETHRDAAGFFFYTEFFIYDWGPSNPQEDLMVTRYRKTTLPHWECTKYMYLPSRTVSTLTHSIDPRKYFTSYEIPAEEAVLHHYRQCPDDVWRTCSPKTIEDHVMSRFSLKHGLYERVLAVRKATNTKTQWTVTTDS